MLDAMSKPRVYDGSEPWPVRAWVHLDLPNFRNYIWFTYVDPEMGFSAGSDGPGGLDAEKTHVIARPPWTGITCTPLSAEEITTLSLPAEPDWLRFYGPQPEPGSLWGIWRNDPALAGKFHPEFPDDIQVIVHEGGRRFAKHPPEVIWVRVTDSRGGIYTGVILNTPFGLTSVRQGSVIKFLMPKGIEHPIMVTDKYLAERDHWIVHPCHKCGFTELFDAPSDFIKVTFSNRPVNTQTVCFTSFCGACGEGSQVVENKDIPAEAKSPPPRRAQKRRSQFRK